MSGPILDQWEQYKQKVLARLVEAKFAPVYGEIQNAKPSGDGYMLGCCPLHEDTHPSLGYSTVTGVWSCFSGCGQGDAFEFLVRVTGRPFKDVMFEMGDLFSVPRPTGAGDEDTTIIYEYRNEFAALLYQVIRSPGKNFYQRRPDGSGGWINDLKGVPRVLYRLPELLDRSDEMVFVVEGERDTDRLHSAGLLATTNSGGSGKWKQSLSEYLRGRDVVIIPDNDRPGRDHAEMVSRALEGIAATIKIVVLPGLPEKGDVSDWFAAGHNVQELQALVAKTPLREFRSDEDSAGTRPDIMVSGHQMLDVIEGAWRALLGQNDPPRLYVTSGLLSRLVDGESGPSIQFLNEAAAYGFLLRAANWMQQRGGQIRDSKPPAEVSRDILANPHPDLPQLDAVATTPVFDADGHLLCEPGYHAKARIWLNCDRMDVPVPDKPTAVEVERALELIREHLFYDFPFASESDEAHAMAALLLPFVRRMITGPTPIHLVEAPTPGSGKSLLADLIAIVATGTTSEATTVTKNEDEARKKLTAILSRGRAVVVIDNVQGGLDSSQLASAITTDIWSDRILGKTQMVEFPNKVTWLVTGNNPRLTMEIARRCVRIRLEPKQERPWERSGFRHDPIRIWTQAHRQELIWSVLVIVQSWIAAGRPAGNKSLGSFEDWATVIGGILKHAGVRDFLEDTKEFYETADSETGEWKAFINAWWERYDTAPVAPADLMSLAEAGRHIPFAYAASSDQARLAKFGRALSGLRNRKFGGVQVVVSQNRKRGSNDYRLVTVSGDLFNDTKEQD